MHQGVGVGVEDHRRHGARCGRVIVQTRGLVEFGANVPVAVAWHIGHKRRVATKRSHPVALVNDGTQIQHVRSGVAPTIRETSGQIGKTGAMVSAQVRGAAVLAVGSRVEHHQLVVDQLRSLALTIPHGFIGGSSLFVHTVESAPGKKLLVIGLGVDKRVATLVQFQSRFQRKQLIGVYGRTLLTTHHLGFVEGRVREFQADRKSVV